MKLVWKYIGVFTTLRKTGISRIIAKIDLFVNIKNKEMDFEDKSEIISYSVESDVAVIKFA